MSQSTTATIYCECNGGGGVYVYTLALVRAINNVAAVTLLTHPPKNPDDEKRLEVLEMLCERIVMLDKNPYKRKLLSKMESALGKYRSDWFIPNYRDFAFAATVHAKRLGYKNIFIAHGDGYFGYAIRYQHVIDYFVCPVRKSQQHLLSALRKARHEQVIHIPHAISPLNASLRRSKSAPSHPIKLLYHGRIEFETKNLLELVRIARALSCCRVAFELHVVGDGPDRQALEQAFGDIAEHHLIKFYPFVLQEELPKFFELCDVAVLTSPNEGFCYSLAEAMLYGLPGIAYECGGTIDDYLVSGINGFIVRRNSSGEFAERIAELCSNTALYASQSAAAMTMLEENFSFSSFQEAYTKLFSRKQTAVGYWWPWYRPKLAPDSVRSLSGVIEWCGRAIKLW